LNPTGDRLSKPILGALGPSTHPNYVNSDSTDMADHNTDAMANDTTVAADATDQAAAQSWEAKAANIANNMRQHLGDFDVTSVTESPMKGIYEVVSNGSILYVNEEGNLLIDGNMIDLATRSSITDKRLGELHMTILADLSEDEMLTYQPENPTGRSITVFTDISCGFCQRLHAEIDTLLDSGVAVNYLLFPRAGINTPAADALESVWCNDDPQAAMTTAKSGGRVPSASCENPMEMHVALAREVGLRGTPLIYLDTGERVPGYRDAVTLVEMVTSNEKFVQ